MTYFKNCSFVALILSVAQQAVAAEEATPLADYYGFKEVEVIKLEERSKNLRAADLDGDGRTDLILVDNSHSRIDWLRQREKPSDAAKPTTADVNSVSNSWRFEHLKIPVDREIMSLVTGDFDNDGRDDIAYVGAPDRLVIRYASKDSPDDWTRKTEQRLPDLSDAGVNLAAGDLNGDNRMDLAVLGKQKIYVVLQDDDGKLKPAESLMNTSSGLALAQAADLDGDGRTDLCYTSTEGSDSILCGRLQTEFGALGPELRFPLSKPRSVTLANVDGSVGREILTIDASTGRLTVSKLRRPEEKPGELAGRLVQYGFGDQGSRNDRDLGIGDVDGDGRLDVVVTDPQSAQTIVFLQKEGAGLDLGSTYPAFVGSKQVRVEDLDGDNKAEVYVLSSDESTVGVSRYEDGRLSFPKPIAVGEKPLAFDLADINDDGRNELVVVSKGDSSGKYKFAAWSNQDGKWSSTPLGNKEIVEVSLKGDPEQLVHLDANRDGKTDFVVFLGQGRSPHIFLSNESEGLTELITSSGVGLGNIAAGALSFGTVLNPNADDQRKAILVSQGNFTRNIELAEGQWRVVDQYNADENGAKIEGSATLDLDGEPGNEIVLVDTGVKKLRILKADGSLYKRWKEVETGTFPFVSARVADLNGDRRDDLLLFGRGRFAVLYAGQSDPRLEDIASYESDLEKTFFIDVVAGDLNADGYADLAMLDTQSHFVEILDYDPTLGPRHAVHFPIFEQKSFSNEGGGRGVEPREAVIADVTGDGRADLILLVHDRVLVYPQDDGTTQPEEVSSAN